MGGHVSVLLEETVAGLAVRPDGIYVDGTLGRGGHSEAILRRLTKGHLYCFDQDPEAITASAARLAPYAGKFTLIRDNFRNLKKDLQGYGVSGFAGLTLDLGVSSPMFDQAERGFSYNLDGPLDMRMDPAQPLSACQIVNDCDQSELTRIIREYGEDPYAARIARAIAQERSRQPIRTTGQLAEIVKEALPAKARNAKGHPAKRTFQAIRIAVNDELGALEAVISDALEMLEPGGRIAVISFQSLEDRIVKQAFRRASSVDPGLKKLPLTEAELPPVSYRLLTNKPIEASGAELQDNHRSHSAKLRIIERIKRK